MKTHVLVILLSVLAGQAAAQSGADVAEERATKLARAAQMHEQARQLRAESEKRQAGSDKACWEKFLVSACLEDARQAKAAAEREAKQLEREARDLEREVKKADLAAKEARRAEEAPRREAEAAARAEKNRLEQEEAMRRVEKRQAEGATKTP